jgi:lycopene cyclase domain-containing protein
VAHLHYLLVLAFIGACAIFVALLFRIRKPHFWRFFLLTDFSILIIYLSWDFWAINRRNWYFDTKQIIGSYILGKMPIEEVLFFIIVPLTTIMTYLALMKLTGWGGEKS